MLRVYYLAVYNRLRTPTGVFLSREDAARAAEALVEGAVRWEGNCCTAELSHLEHEAQIFEFDLRLPDDLDPLRDLAFKILAGDPVALDAARDVLRC